MSLVDVVRRRLREGMDPSQVDDYRRLDDSAPLSGQIYGEATPAPPPPQVPVVVACPVRDRLGEYPLHRAGKCEFVLKVRELLVQVQNNG